ncbi:hypothetical protein I4U23_007766 [Adineta vaga]|nr:hypothetical protein I4U23_007766 [Adineta vaga]
MNHLITAHAQYGGFGGSMFSSGGYPMSYDPNSFYPLTYDHRGMPISMHGGGYDFQMDMYPPQCTSSTSSRSRNTTDYEQEINAFLRHTTTSNIYPSIDNGTKSHRNHHYHRNENDYRHKTSSRQHSKSREHRR